jgi:hypothetical protein
MNTYQEAVALMARVFAEMSDPDPELSEAEFDQLLSDWRAKVTELWKLNRKQTNEQSKN